MKILKLLILLFILSSCQKKEVQLPQLGDPGVTDIYNTSKIWIFFNVVKGDTIGSFNKNNKIANTNLIFNIDKRLPIKEVIPKIHQVKYDALNALVHKTVGKRFYLSYADTLTNTFALYDFTDTNYIFTPKENQSFTDSIHKKKEPLFINIRKNEILLNSTRVSNLNDTIEKIFAKDSLHRKTILLQFDGNISYAKYLSLRSGFYHKGYTIENVEYIYEE